MSKTNRKKASNSDEEYDLTAEQKQEGNMFKEQIRLTQKETEEEANK